MTTKPIVVPVNQDALTIKADATFSLTTGTLQSFSDLTDLLDGVPQVNPYATFETDYWLLDGGMKLMPNNPTVGLMTTDMSAANTNYGTPPVLTITFGSVHSTNGLILYFSEISNDWCDSVTVKFYNSTNVLIQNDTYTPSSAIFETNQAVSNFKKIEIIFNSTNKARRYTRLTGIDFDEQITFQGDAIRAASLVEQINPLSVELPTNELSLTLFSAGGDFSIVDPQGFYANLQNKEPLDVYENLHGEIVYIGRFYLDKWESISENEAVFQCVDALGVEEISEGIYYTTQEGVWTNDLSEDIIDEIFVGTQFEYELDASLTGIQIPGWIPAVSRREALQQICFRLGAYATCARSNKIQIKPFELASDLVAFDHSLTNSDKGIVSPVQMRPLVTGVKILTSHYQYLATNKVVFNGYLPLGNHIILFPDGVINEVATQSGGTGVKSSFFPGANHIPVTVSTAGTFEFTSQTYFERLTSPVTLVNGSLPAGTPTNVINIDDATLITSGITNTQYSVVTDVIQRVYDYYQQRYIQKTKLFASPIAVGDSVLISTQSSRQIAGIVERMTTDLANGFVSDLEIVGVVVPL